ncbi:MAG: GIY-YIG nuclease family protein [Candidatus Thermoplasmatota archaeon]|nr:GIY-YIG nuclease family protein [Candidatus Thermoplasmatota archaeon]
MITYVLLIELQRTKEIEVGKLGVLRFKKGYYAYVGSAKRNMRQRLERHMREEKKLHWHIDYLLRESEIEEIFLSEKEECEVAKAFSPFYSVPGFGCSDCSCGSHLFYSEDLRGLEAVLSENYLYYAQHNR